jgi:hypothetical protein
MSAGPSLSEDEKQIAVNYGELLELTRIHNRCQ